MRTMPEPIASRPHMPGYGVVGADEGSGLLPWSWAQSRLERSRHYWVATTWPDTRPHVMPVWGVWQDGLWFSSSRDSRKVRNLRRNARCVVTTQNPVEPVVLEGAATIVTEAAALQLMIDLVNAKYGTSYDVGMLDPSSSATVQVRPSAVFALDESDFSGSPTRWTFE